MKKIKLNIPKWRKLDNSAKIFPLSSGRKNSTVFRLSVILKENIDVKILKKAVIESLDRYKCFKVKMKKGFFWHYLKFNEKTPIIEKEKNEPCKFINPNTNNEYLFKITYRDNRINIDIFHALTDGNNGAIFFKEIIYTYLELKYPKQLKSKNNRAMRKVEYDTEDSYIKNYNKRVKPNKTDKRAYKIVGEKLNKGKINVVHQIIDLKELKMEAKRYNATITQYLTAVLMYSIYSQNYLKYNGKAPIKVCIPVNLKKYFPSKTITNFFSYITIEGNTKKLNFNLFDEILGFVKKEFDRQLTIEEVIKIMSNNVKLGTHIFIKSIPLFLKIPIVRLAYLEIRRHFTITYSNIGRIGILGEYQKYIDNFFVLIAPESFERVKCSSCTFENKIVFTSTGNIEKTGIEVAFLEFLKQKNIRVEMVCENY